MGIETISVVYKPIAPLNGIPVYHETLVYTNSSGQTFYSSAGPLHPIDLKSASGLVDIAQSAVSSMTNGTSFFGTLVAKTNVAFDSNNIDPNSSLTSSGVIRDSNGNLYSSQTITSGTNLSSVWNTINSTENAISNQLLSYSLLTQNSNSLANTALVAAGLQPPSLAWGIFQAPSAGVYWTPGGDILLPGSSASANQSFLTDHYSTTSTTDASGNVFTTIMDKNSSGSTLGQITFSANSAGNVVNSSLYVGSNNTLFGTEAATSGPVDNITKIYAPAGQLTGTTQFNADNTGFLTAGGQTINFSAGEAPILSLGTHNNTIANFLSPSGSSLPVSFDLSSSGITATAGGNTFADPLLNSMASLDPFGNIDFSNSNALAVYTNQGQLAGTATTQTLSNGDGQTTAKDAAGNALGTFTSHADGSYDPIVMDPQKNQTVLATHVNGQDQATSETSPPDVDVRKLSQAVAATLAAQLISSVLIKNNLPASIAAQAFANAVIDNVLPTQATQNMNFNELFAASVFNIAGGIIGSQAGAAVARALGVPSQVGSLVGGAATQQLVNLAAQSIGILPAAGASGTGATAAGNISNVAQFADALAAAGGGILGSQFASFIMPPTMAGEITGAVSSAAALAALTNPATATLEIFAIAFGSDFLGNLLGDVISGLFGGHPSVGPNATATLTFNSSTKQFYMDYSNADNGGDVTIARSLANSAITALNDILQAIGGTISFPAGTPRFGLGYFKGLTFSADEINNPNQYQTNQFANPSDAVNDTVIRVVKDMKIQGGDTYMQYVLNNTTATTVAALTSDLNAAHAYSLYVTNPQAFYLSLAMAGDAADLQNWQTELARVHTLGLDLLQVPGSTLVATNGTLNASNTSVFLAANTTGASITGNGDVIHAVNGDKFSVSGNNDTITETSGNITLDAGMSGAILLGDSNTVAVGNQTKLMVMGSNDILNMGDGASVMLNSGTANTLNATHTTISATSGVKFNVNGGGNTITAGIGDTIGVSGNGQYGWSNGITMSNGTVNLADSACCDIAGSGNTILAGNNDMVGIDSGNNNTITVGTNGSVFMDGGGVVITGTVVNATGGGIRGGKNVSFTVKGGGNTITASSGDSVFLTNGGNNTVNAANGDTVDVNGNGTSGADNYVVMSSGTVKLENNTQADIYGSSNTVTAGQSDTVGVTGDSTTITTGTGGGVWINGGNHDTVTVAGNSSVFVNNGGNNTVNAVAGDYVDVNGNGSAGGDNVVTMSGGTVKVEDATQSDLYGSNNQVTVGIGAWFGLNGSSNTVTADRGTGLWLNGGNNNTFTLGDGDYVTMSSGESGVVFNATHCSISASTTDNFTVNGAGNQISAGNGDTVRLSGNGQYGWSNMITMSSGTVTVADNACGDIVGSSNAITLGNNDMFMIDSGNNNTVTTGTNGNVQLASHTTAITGTTINTSGGVVVLRGPSTSMLNGSNDNITVNDNGVNLTVNGNNETINFGSGMTEGKLWLQRNGNDLVVDLMGTTSKITVKNWYSTTLTESFTASDGLKLDSQIAQLVSAMATYSSGHTSFNPATATAMPTDTTLQNAITAAWHH